MVNHFIQKVKKKTQQRRQVALREYNRARKRFSRYVRSQRLDHSKELAFFEKEKQRSLAELNMRVERKIQELEIEKREWQARTDSLQRHLDQAEEE